MEKRNNILYIILLATSFILVCYIIFGANKPRIENRNKEIDIKTYQSSPCYEDGAEVVCKG